MEIERLEYIERVNSDRFKDRVSRRKFMGVVLAATGGAVGASALGSSAVLADSEDLTTILNLAATAEALAVTYLGAVINGAFANTSGTDATVKAVLTAARAEEQAHYNYLTAAGAKPVTTTFTVPASADPSNKTKALQTIEAAEGLFINAYLSAVATLAGHGNHKLAVVAASILGTECEHRALARAALVLGGDSSFSPPNNLDFEQAPLPTVTAVAGKLKELGFIGGSGTAAQYPGPGNVDAAGVTGTNPPELEAQGGAPGMPNTGTPPGQHAGLIPPGLGVAGLAVSGGAAALLALRRRADRMKDGA